MKDKFGEILSYAVIGVMIPFAIVGGLLVEFWKWLKNLSPKKKPIEEAEEKIPKFEFHCHECGEHFKVGGLILDNGFECKLLANSKTCPNCGSSRIDPLMFEDDDFIPWLKHSWL